MSTSKSKSTDPYDQAGTAPEDPRDVALAELRQRLELQEAALGRLQELAATALQPCSCNLPAAQGERRSFFLMGNTLFCSSGHYAHFGAEQE